MTEPRQFDATEGSRNFATLRQTLGNLAPLRRLRIYFILLALAALFSALSPLFACVENFFNVLVSSATLGLLSIGASLVIGAAGLDLSVGSLLALSGSCAALAASVPLPWPAIVACCLLSGTLAGSLNGLIIARLRIPPFIATLGMLSVARGAALIITDGRPIYGLPSEIVFIGQGAIAGVPMPVWVLLLVAALAQLLLRRTSFGAHALCIGDNEKAAYNAGVKVSRHKMALYALSGFLAALAGLVFIGRVNAADPAAGAGYELSAITGAILGGTHIFGGRASVLGAVVGALIMGVLENGLTLLAVPSYYQQLAVGVVLVAAVSLDRLVQGEEDA